MNPCSLLKMLKELLKHSGGCTTRQRNLVYQKTFRNAKKKNEGGLVSKLSEKWNTIFIVGHVLTVNLSFLFIGEKSVVAAVQLLLRIDPVWRLQTFATLFFQRFFQVF